MNQEINMTRKQRKRYVRYGFTMVELMAILIIIGLLATVVVTKVASKIDQAWIRVDTQPKMRG
jgi:prepilin-type N-terminal cleavage/methylation domain-containing protein